MLNTTDRHGGVVFGLYGQQEPTTERPALEQTKTARAEEFLREVLAVGPVPSSEIERMAGTRGFRAGVLKTARANLGVVAVRDGSIRAWKVQLPDSRSASA